MNPLLRALLPVSLLFLVAAAPAQNKVIDRNGFSAIDIHVARAGPLNDFTLKRIVDSITAPCTDQYGQLRAIYMWISTNISYDCYGHHHAGASLGNATEALNKRSTTHSGYADLFRQMCHIAHIRCETVDGWSKRFPEDIGEAEPGPHSWNVVCIDNTWFVVDAAWGAGTTDRKVRNFSRSFTDAWFLTDRQLFALCHFPRDKSKQLLPEPIGKKEFSKAPVVGAAAAIFAVVPEADMSGSFKSREDSTQKFFFTMRDRSAVQKVSVSWDGQPAEAVAFYRNGPQLEVEIIMAAEGSHTMTLLINDHPAFTFNARLAKKKPLPSKRTKS